MRRVILFLLALLLGLAQLAFVSIAHADNPIYITQVQTTGGPGHTDQDFIELFNPGSEPVNLKNHRLVKRTAEATADTLIKSWSEDAFIAPHAFYLWANSSLAGAVAADVSGSATIADNNGVAIRSGANDTGLILDSAAWGTTNNTLRNVFSQSVPAGQALARINLYDAASGFEVRTSAARNSSIMDIPPSSDPPVEIACESPVENPLSSDESSASTDGNEDIGNEDSSDEADSNEDDNSSDAATNNDSSSESISSSSTSSTTETTTTSDSSSSTSSTAQPTYEISAFIKISEIVSNPERADSGQEAVELVNTGATAVRVDGWILDDATVTGRPKSSAYGISGTIQARSYVFVIIPAGRFTLNNTGDTVNLYFPDQTLADRVQYDGSGKEGESYQNVGGTWQWGELSLGQENLAPPEAAEDVETTETNANLETVTIGQVAGVVTTTAAQAAVKAPAKTAAAKPAANKPAAKTSTAATATALEKSMDKKLTVLQNSLDNFSLESGQNFSSLSSAIQASQQDLGPSEPDQPPGAPARKRNNWIIFTVIIFVLAAAVAIKLIASRAPAERPAVSE